MLKQRKQNSTFSQPASRPRGRVEVAHQESLYQCRKISILAFWISASASVFLFPVTLVFSEIIFRNAAQTKDLLAATKHDNFQAGTRLGAGIGFSLLAFFFFLYNFVLVAPRQNFNQEQQQPIAFIFSWTIFFGILFVLWKFLMRPNFGKAPNGSIMYQQNSDENYNNDDDDDYDDKNTGSDGHSSFPPMSCLQPASNCVDDANSMTLPPVSEEDIRAENETRRIGIETTVGMTMMMSMLILILGFAVTLTVAVKWLKISL
jgi:hypothetical protein